MAVKVWSVGNPNNGLKLVYWKTSKNIQKYFCLVLFLSMAIRTWFKFWQFQLIIIIQSNIVEAIVDTRRLPSAVLCVKGNCIIIIFLHGFFVAFLSLASGHGANVIKYLKLGGSLNLGINIKSKFPCMYIHYFLVTIVFRTPKHNM